MAYIKHWNEATWIKAHTHTTTLRPFFQDYSGEPVPEENLLLDFYGAGQDDRGRHTDHPAGRHCIWTKSATHLHHLPPLLHWMPFLLQPSQFILAWDRHQMCWLAYPVAWLNKSSTLWNTKSAVCRLRCIINHDCFNTIFLHLAIQYFNAVGLLKWRALTWGIASNFSVCK